MKTDQNVNFARGMVLITGCLVTLFVSPWNSIDPMNLPKMMILIFLSLVGFGSLLVSKRVLFSKSRHLLFLLVLLFLVWLFVTTLRNQNEIWTKLYGTPGRNTGFLSYLSLTLLMLSSAIVANEKFLKTVSFSLITLGGVLAAYGLLQFNGIEFFNYTGAGESISFGTFGNVNFQSAFLGIATSLTLCLAIFHTWTPRRRISLLSLSVFMLFAIQTSSAQGYFSMAAGLSFSIILWLANKKKNKLAALLISLYISGSLALILGFLNQGPLARYVFNASIEVRGFYWYAAYRIVAENPIFGIGLDSYGDYYRSARSSSAIAYNTELTSNTAHNIPLDIAAGGGVLLLLIYFSIMALALVSIIKVVTKSSEVNPFFISLAGAWAAYQSQSLISINQLGVGIWGWILTGLLIGYEINTRETSSVVIVKSKMKVQSLKKTSNSLVLGVLISGIIGAAVAFPPYVASSNYYKAIQSGQLELLVARTYSKPYDRSRFLITVDNLISNKLEPEAIEMLNRANFIYPNSFELWQQWLQLSTATQEQLAKAKREMLRLDPNNPTLK